MSLKEIILLEHRIPEYRERALEYRELASKFFKMHYLGVGGRFEGNELMEKSIEYDLLAESFLSRLLREPYEMFSSGKQEEMHLEIMRVQLGSLATLYFHRSLYNTMKE